MNIHHASLAISAGSIKQFLPNTLPEIVFSGRSNVGKSSLLNLLLNRKALARVSAVPGKTVTINFYNIDGKAYFVDLPGYGYAKKSNTEKAAWSSLVEEYFTSGRRIDLVIQLIDMRHPPTVLDRDMLWFLLQNHLPFCVVLTKCDKLNKQQYEDALKRAEETLHTYHPLGIFPFSAVKRTGCPEILAFVKECIEQNHTIEE